MLGKSSMKVAVGAAAVAVFAAGCTGGGSDETEPASNAVVIGIAEPQSLLPGNSTEPNGAQVLSALFYPLVTFDEQQEPVEAAAQSITTENNRDWTVKLQDGFTFSNGEKVGADNYINAWNYAAYGPNAQRASYFFERIDGYDDLQSKDPDGPDGAQRAPEPDAKTLAGLEKVDDLTFTVRLSSPFAGWRSVLASSAFHPLPNAAFSAPGVIADGFGDAVIGNGPFKMKGAWQHGAQIQVEKVDGFKGPPVKVQGIAYKIYEDPRSEYADLVAGAVDVQTAIPVENLASAPQDLEDRFRKSPNSVFQFVGFPTFQKEFAKADVRHAISMAIDRQALTDQIFLGSQVPATAFVSPAVPGYRPDSCGKWCVHDPAEAKKLYTSAGGPSEIRISYNSDGNHKPWVDAMCGQITATLGAACVGVAEAKFTDLLTRVEKKDPVGMIRLAWVMDYPLMESYLGPLFTTNGSSNYYGYSDSQFDSLVTAGSAARSAEAAVEKWQDAEDVLAADMPVIPLRFGQNVYGHSPRVTGVQVDLFQRVDVYSIALAG